MRLEREKAFICEWPEATSSAIGSTLEVLPRDIRSVLGAERGRRRVRVVWSEVDMLVTSVVLGPITVEDDAL